LLPPRSPFETYQTDTFYDELFAADGVPHEAALPLVGTLKSMSRAGLRAKQKLAEERLYSSGNTFNVYGDKKGTEKILPFDIIPRVITAHQWDKLDLGIAQRIRAMNLFINDIYNDQKIVKDGIIPAEMIFPPPVLSRGYGPIFRALILCAMAMANSTSLRTICAVLRAFPTFWKTVRS